jgi:hydroxyacyl-ACP dehydratase HTD2-like protein with hotdog domain
MRPLEVGDEMKKQELINEGEIKDKDGRVGELEITIFIDHII